MTTIAPPPPPLAASLAPQQGDPVRPGHTVHGSGHKMARHIRLGAIALALMGVAAFGIIIVSAYDSTPSPDDVPVVTAGGSPLRERPVDEGGMQVANRDSTVFNSLSSGPVDAPIEQLVPPPEQPVDMPSASVDQSAGTLPTARRPDGSPALTAEEIRALHAQRRAQMMPPGDAATQAMSQLETAANNVPAGVSDGMTSTVVTERMEAPAPASATAAAPAPVTAPAMADEGAAITDTAAAVAPAQVAPAEAPPEVPLGSAAAPTLTPQVAAPAATAAAPPVAAAPAPAPRAAQAAPVASGNRLVQLGAVRTEEAAKAEWRRLQTKFRAQLGNLTPSIERADLGARGIYWRIRGGSVSADSGKSICDALKAAGQSCMVVGR